MKQAVAGWTATQPLLPILLLYVAGLAADVVDLNIGLVLNKNDDVTRKVISLAVEMANTDLEESKYRLQVRTEIVDDNKSFYVIRKGCNLLRHGLIALLAPGLEGAPSRHISSLAARFHVPHLVTRCRFPDSVQAYPMDVRMHPDCDSFARVILHYVTKVESWSNMVIVHSNEDTILKFENLVNQIEFKLKMRRWKHHDLANNKELMRELSKTKNHHHVLVDIPYWQVTDFLIMASVHNLTEPQYTFIFSDWDVGLVDLAAFKINNLVNITAFSFINDTVVKAMISREKKVKTLITAIIESEGSAKKADIFPNFMAHAAIVFDSVTMLARGIAKLALSATLSPQPLDCDGSHTWSHGPSLINAIQTVDNFYGVTGRMDFDVMAQRKNFNLTVLELTENGFTTSGFWTDKHMTLLELLRQTEEQSNQTETIPLKVTTLINIPFVMYTEQNVDVSKMDTDPRMWDGYCVDLLKEIGKDLKLNFSISVVPDQIYGIQIENETNPDGTEKWNGMIGELMTKKADLALGPVTISYERERVVDFTTPYMSLGLSIMFKRPMREAPSLFSFLEPLSPPVWGYVISAYISVSMILYFISHVTPYEWLPSHPCDDDSEKENQFTFLNSLWFAVGALVQQGCEIAPQASSTRLISGAWWFFTLIIISTYTANLAAFLTVERFVVPIKNVEDLANQTDIKYGTIRGGTSEAFFEKALIHTYKRMYKFMKKHPEMMMKKTMDGIAKVLDSKTKYAFLLESAMSDFYRQRNCDLMKVGDPLDSKGYGIVFPAGSPLRDDMTETILKLQKAQKLDALKHKWWNEINITEPCEAKKSASAPQALMVAQVGGVFVLLGIGFVVALFTSMLELYVYFHRHRLYNKLPFSRYLSKELKFAMRFMSSSKKLKLSSAMGISRSAGEKLHLLTSAAGGGAGSSAVAGSGRMLEECADSPVLGTQHKRAAPFCLESELCPTGATSSSGVGLAPARSDLDSQEPLSDNSKFLWTLGEHL